MGHKQPATQLQKKCNGSSSYQRNSTTKNTKAMDMKFHWLSYRECQEQIKIHWQLEKPTM